MLYKACFCCGSNTIPEKTIFRVCPVCGWQDDEIQNSDPDFWGGANQMSLNEARSFWQKEGNAKHIKIFEPKQKCMCCNSDSVSSITAHKVCPVCGWENDDSLNSNPDAKAETFQMSLNEAKLFWEKEKKQLPDGN